MAIGDTDSPRETASTIPPNTDVVNGNAAWAAHDDVQDGSNDPCALGGHRLVEKRFDRFAADADGANDPPLIVEDRYRHAARVENMPFAVDRVALLSPVPS
jgi:hypothetical protein